MEPSTHYLLAADAVLLLHMLFVAFVLIGLVSIFIGNIREWSWVRNPRFRVIHLLAIAIVVIQSWFSVICPLTTFEMVLRSRAGNTVYSGSFIAHWIESLLFYQLPPWVFVVGYTVFGAVVAGSWFWVRPRPFSDRDSHLNR
jgi:hypothetical protein